MQIAIEESSAKRFVEYPTDFELVIIDQSQATVDVIHSVSVSNLKSQNIMDSLEMTVHEYYPNAFVNQRGIINKKYNEFGHDFKLIPLPKTYEMDKKNVPGLDLTFIYKGIDVGRFIFWGGMGSVSVWIVRSYLFQISFWFNFKPSRKGKLSLSIVLAHANIR